MERYVCPDRRRLLLVGALSVVIGCAPERRARTPTESAADEDGASGGPDARAARLTGTAGATGGPAGHDAAAPGVLGGGADAAAAADGSGLSAGNGRSDGGGADASDASVPRPPGGPRLAIQISASEDSTCVLFDTGTVRCWGRSDGGRLGGSGVHGPDVPINGKVVQVAAGYLFTCALLETGAVRCWGNGNPGPTKDVSLGGKAVRVTAGKDHACAVLDGGALRCWGSNTYGQLGYGHTRRLGDPAAAGDVNVGGKVLDVSAGLWHTCALMEGGAVRCWGDHSLGQLGYGNTTRLQNVGGANTTNIGDNEAPATAGDVSVGGKVVQLSAGEAHTCVVFDTGAGRCWGWGFHGRNGIGNDAHIGDNEVPSKVPEYKAGGRVLQICAQGKGTCALMETGNVRCWGYGGHGTLGLGNTASKHSGEQAGDVPLGVKVSRLPDHGGYYHSCVITEKGTVRCWGFNFYGQLGYGNRNDIGDNEPASLAGDIAF